MLRPIHKIWTTPHFERSFRKLPKEIQALAIRKEALFRANVFDVRLKTHTLKGKLKELYSYAINQNYRLLFEFLSSDEVIYHDIGTHKVYR